MSSTAYLTCLLACFTNASSSATENQIFLATPALLSDWHHSPFSSFPNWKCEHHPLFVLDPPSPHSGYASQADFACSTSLNVFDCFCLFHCHHHHNVIPCLDSYKIILTVLFSHLLLPVSYLISGPPPE